jgi:type II secretory pathway component GspD/PulD (secretin)
VRGSVIRVFPRELETRIYNVDHVITQRTGRRSIGGATDVVSTDAPDVFADLTTGVRALLSDEGRVGLDRTAGLLQVTDRAGRLARVEQYLETAMLRAERQVQIDARVVDVQLTSDAPAIDWRRVSREVSGADTAGSRAGTTMIVTASDPGVLLTALRAQGRVDVLASPTVTAMNNEPALVRVTTHEGQTVTGDVTLSVTPQISVDGIIEMSLSASVTSRVDSTVAVREADTVVRLRQGETAMIAGLLRDRPAAPVPGGGPDTARRTDTVILITPTMVQSRAATVPAGAR